MSDPNNLVKSEFQFGSTIVRILQSDIKAPGVEADVVVSTDDNHLTMSSGIARVLAEKAGSRYMAEAHTRCPVRAGTIVATGSYKLEKLLPKVRYVLHAAVVDYDTSERSLDEIVLQATTSCLQQAEELELHRVLFPAFATGSGGLSMERCAHQMCSAIKLYLAEDRSITEINLVLYLPQLGGTVTAEKIAEYKARNESFLKEANLVLGVPYDPSTDVSQIREFYAAEDAVQQIEATVAGNRHAVILGGPRIGKSALLYQLFFRAQQPGSALSQGRRVVRVPFGVLLPGTPAAFIYRKLLLGLRDNEADTSFKKAITQAYADADMDCAKFLEFLADHADRYPRVVFLIDNLPRLLQPGTEDFWRDFDRLEERVQFVFTARDDARYGKLCEQLSADWKARLDEVRLKCIEDSKRKDWVDQLYQRYLGRHAADAEHEFFSEEAGRHPYLIGMACYALIEALKRDTLTSPAPLTTYDRLTLSSFFKAARNAMERPRRTFFDSLLKDDILSARDRSDLKNLAQAVAAERESRRLIQDLDRDDPQAMERWQALLQQDNPRLALHEDSLRRLEGWGYLVDAADPKTAQFMAGSFAVWAQAYFGIGDRSDEKPRDVIIGLLSPEVNMVSTLFGRRGARLVSAHRRLPKDIRDKFMESFRTCINHLLHPPRYPTPGVFDSLEKVASFILTYFTTSAIKDYLQNPPKDATILLTVDDALKDIPWELMLEAAYGGDIPFRVGRSIVSEQAPHSIKPPVRGEDKIKALLIGDPTGDLPDARQEVLDLREKLRRDGRFEVEDSDVWIGPEQCQWLPVLDTLSSGKYGLIHYSGHTKFDGYQSAWYLKDGKITTDLLTSALQNAPPVLVFSSSCESAVGAEVQPVQYENQTFDLPSAFLQAGVEAYVGTLWEVEATAARTFVEVFYDAFLSREYNLGECLRRAKSTIKDTRNRTAWLAFILYGDPHAMPGELFPSLAESVVSSQESGVGSQDLAVWTGVKGVIRS